jgi:ATP-binding cassette subfamily F protein uup
MGYLQDFLFSPERARSPVRSLSGGERNRLLLAKLFTKPANLLVMDEPTNDLDVETLELLEELLLEYQGTLLLVSHDRAFINNVVTSTIVFEGDGELNEYVGGYDDWLRQRPDDTPQPVESTPKSSAAPRTEKKKAARPAKLSYKDQRELDALPQTIERLEQELAAVHQTMADPAFYQQDGDVIAGTKEQLEKLEAELGEAFERWEALEAMLNG